CVSPVPRSLRFSIPTTAGCRITSRSSRRCWSASPKLVSPAPVSASTSPDARGLATHVSSTSCRSPIPAAGPVPSPASAPGGRRSDRARLLELAEGRLRYSTVLRAIADGDDDAVRRNLGPACRLLPDLDIQQEVVARRVGRMGNEVSERARYLAVAATLWPDQH